MCDEDLIKAAQRGDDEAFYKLISAHKDKLYNVAYCYLKNEQDALEAIQEVTCRAYVTLNRLREPKYFTTWLTRIIINYCIDEQKRKNRVVFIHEESAAHCNNHHEDNLVLQSAIEELEPKYKKVIILKYFQDMTLAAIAKVMDCPEGTIKTWNYRALKQLRELLDKGGNGSV